MTKRELTDAYPTDLPAWQALEEHCRDDMRSSRLRDLFVKNRDRFNRFSLEAGDLFLDYSKNLVNSKTRKLLVSLANEAGVPQAIGAMFAGDQINVTEHRPALHVALRAEISDEIAHDVSGVQDVWNTLERMTAFVNSIHSGERRGITGRRLKQIINIGIGGSDLGAVMASRALKHYWQPDLNFYSVSNVDGTQLADLMDYIDPEETLFVVCSKTFTTQETMTNAKAAREWLSGTLGESAVSNHFAAVSTDQEAMDQFGINTDCRFEFWDWIGCRFSIWSSVGLSLALVVGMDRFQEMLTGARRIDHHLRTAPLESNMPVLLAMIGIWYNNFFGAETHAILPYDNRLDRFPAFLQQLQMESSGKGVRKDGQPVACKTGAIVWGEAGSNGQHAFYQLLHQGTRFIPVDFILPTKSSGAIQEQHDIAIANCLAQAEVLMDGFKPEGTGRHRALPGNRPSNLVIFDRLTPAVLGQLIALYEHKVFVEGVIWGINSFDQFGVELGKRLANQLLPAVIGDERYGGDNPSTQAVLESVIAAKQRSET